MGVTVPRVFEHMLVCESCSLHKRRRNVVVGKGNYKTSTVLFIGEGPGEDEDKAGLPFVGKAGKRLDEIIGEAGLDSSIIYTSNIVKCRPTIGGKNRPPSSNEIRRCSVHLDLQIKVIQPKVIVVFGNTALQYFCPGLKIVSSHGKILTSKKVSAKIFPVIHPAAGFRTPAWDELLVQDMKELKRLLDGGEFDKKGVVFGPRMIG